MMAHLRQHSRHLQRTLRTWWQRRSARLALRIRQEGQSLVEYGLVIGVVAVLVIVALQAFGNSLVGVFDRIIAMLGTVATR